MCDFQSKRGFIYHKVYLRTGFIFWFKDSELVDYDSSEGRIKVDTTANGRSKLVLLKARREDSANYTCSPSGGKSDSTILTVIEGKKDYFRTIRWNHIEFYVSDERPAAMQTGNRAAAGIIVIGSPQIQRFLFSCFIFYFYQFFLFITL